MYGFWIIEERLFLFSEAVIADVFHLHFREHRLKTTQAMCIFHLQMLLYTFSLSFSLPLSVFLPQSLTYAHTCTKLRHITSCCLSCNRILPGLNLVLEWIWTWSLFFSLLEYDVIGVLKLDHIKNRD